MNFTTAAVLQADQVPPIISKIDFYNITESSATISWTTDEKATSQVEYGTSSSYGLITASDDNLVTNHIVTLNGLASSTTFHFNVKSRDANQNEATGTDRIFRTRAKSDATLPVIFAVSAVAATPSSITVAWTTNKPATSQIIFGFTISYGYATPLDTNLVNHHSMTISGLSPGTTYHVKITSKDEDGNESFDYTAPH